MMSMRRFVPTMLAVLLSPLLFAQVVPEAFRPEGRRKALQEFARPVVGGEEAVGVAQPALREGIPRDGGGRRALRGIEEFECPGERGVRTRPP